ncbi:MAG: DUF554 domain-containing protein [Solobacterium sp.]|nr:DUF554 domain-containing protein [Solobacterium sp.]MCH4265873.1 DUF554 domain-containing protein [Solobacterium sp.]
MPTGVIIDALAVVLGGLLGSALKQHFTDSFKDQINAILGLCSIAMGISAVTHMQNMPAVIFAIILGTALGIWLHLEQGISHLAGMVCSRTDSADQNRMMVTATVLFCASGTGIYGALTAGMNGDMSILISKSILDFFTAAIFACTLGKSVSLIAIPQFLILDLLYLMAGKIVPLTTTVMIDDFKACGGIIMLATGFRMLNLKQFPIADMIPAMILVMPLSWIWVNWILQLI